VGACMDFELAKKLGDTQADELIKQNCKWRTILLLLI
jgi:hypothetical protein